MERVNVVVWHKIADSVVRRLVIYLRALNSVKEAGEKTISSQELAEKAGVSPALVRKDLAWFGEFGTRGVGYEVSYLRHQLWRILKLDNQVSAALVGVGSLGTALVRYNRRKYLTDESFNVRIVALFDNEPRKIGQVVEGLPVLPVEDLPRSITSMQVQMGIIAVPAEHAQNVSKVFTDNGVKAILNFAPATLNVPKGVQVQNADLSLEMQYLAYCLEDDTEEKVRK